MTDYKIIVSQNYKFYKMYKNILNSYVSDYYLEEHWEKLPRSWQEHFDNIEVNQISNLLDLSQPLPKRLYPLSLLSLRCLIINNVLSRKQISINRSHNIFEDKEDFMKLFWKNVKLKKRHEISILSEICYNTALGSNCFYVVDVGSGLGHLSRMLSFGYGLKVCTFESDLTLSNMAKEMDKIFGQQLNRKKIQHKNTSDIVHINKKISADLTPEQFLHIVRSNFNNSEENFKFGIVGLHPCGDLGSALLKLYSNCSNIMFITMASCCYMKLSLIPNPTVGFPLSNYCKNYKLSYLDCEIACHAIENYVTKLKNPTDNQKLKIHAFRAVLEKILVNINPALKHSMVNSVKYNPLLTFKDYCEKNLGKYNVTLCDDDIHSFEDLINKTWQNVVLFYSLRLLLAPLIETIILCDRLLFLKQQNSIVKIVPAFDCNISPRNQVIIAQKILNK